MPLESGRRRKTWRPGNPVVLADGQEWHLAKPRATFGPDANGGVRTYVKLGNHTAEFEAAKKALDDAVEWNSGVLALPEEEQEAEWAAHPEMRPAARAVELGRVLLLANYELSEEEVADILHMSFDADECPEEFAVYEAVAATAAGIAPKPRSGGSASA